MTEQSMWHYVQAGQQVGPVTKEQLVSLFIQQILAPDAMVWTEGMEQWAPANTVDGLWSEIAGAAPMTGAQASYVPTRPTSVTVLGILCIVFGGLGLLCTPIALVGLYMPQPETPGMEIYNSAGMQAYTLFSTAFGFIFSIVEVAAGIGLLNLKDWARKTALAYGWIAIVWGIIGSIVSFLLVSSAVQEMSGQGSPEAMGGMIGGVVGGMCGGIIGLIFPIFLVIYMRKPHVVAACNR